MNRLAPLTLLVASAASAQVVPWAVETQSIPSAQAGDVAIITTNGGLVVGCDTAQVGAYGWVPFNGMLAQILPTGALRGADARGPYLFVTTSNNGLFAFFDGDAGVEPLNPPSRSVLSAGFVALRQKDDDDFMLAVTRTATVQRWDIHIEDGGVAFTDIDTVTIPGVPGGIAADDRTGNLFLTVPTRGVVMIDAPTGGAATTTFVGSIDSGTFGPGIGGIALLPLKDGGVWVLTTNPQGQTVVVHEFNTIGTSLDFIGAAAIGTPDGGMARAALPMHLDTTLAPLPGFSKGMVVVHDGVSANYKLVSLEAFDQVIPLPDLAYRDAGFDAGDVDAGPGSDGGSDAGLPSDAGQSDGGRRDGGGGGGGIVGPGNGVDPPPGCSCGNPLLVFLPAFLLLWWIRRPRSSWS